MRYSGAGLVGCIYVAVWQVKVSLWVVLRRSILSADAGYDIIR